MNRRHKKSGRIYEVLPLSIFEVMTCSIISLFELKAQSARRHCIVRIFVVQFSRKHGNCHRNFFSLIDVGAAGNLHTLCHNVIDGQFFVAVGHDLSVVGKRIELGDDLFNPCLNFIINPPINLQ